MNLLLVMVLLLVVLLVVVPLLRHDGQVLPVVVPGPLVGLLLGE